MPLRNHHSNRVVSSGLLLRSRSLRFRSAYLDRGSCRIPARSPLRLVSGDSLSWSDRASFGRLMTPGLDSSRLVRHSPFLIGRLILQQLIDQHQDLMTQGHQRPLLSHPLRPAMIGRRQEGLLRMAGRPGRLDEHLTEPTVSRGRSTTLSLTGALMVARAHPRP